MNNTTRTIRSEEITIDMRVLTIMEDGRKNGEIYLAAIAPNMELTVMIVILPKIAPKPYTKTEGSAIYIYKLFFFALIVKNS